SDLASAQAKFVDAYLGDKPGVDDLQVSRNKDRFRNLMGETIIDAEIYTADVRPMGRAQAMPRASGGFEKRGEFLVGKFAQDRGDGAIQGRIYLAPITSRDTDAAGEFKVAGYAGIALSLDPAYSVIDKANKNALLTAAAVGGAMLFAAIVAFALLTPLRQVLRDSEEFARGNFDHRPAGARGGEAGALARSVSRIALAARDRIHEAEQKAKDAVPPPPDHREEVGAGTAPGSLLRVAGWEAEGTSRACQDLNGDFFDYAMAADGRLAAVLMETSFIGLPAAFVASSAQGAFRGLAGAHGSAGALLEAIGANVAHKIPKGETLRGVCVVADPTSGEVTLARAGKGNPPVIWRAMDRSLEKVEISGPGLAREGGPGTGVQATETKLKLDARDRLSLFSTGLYRARNAKKEKFGEENLDGLILKFGPMNSTAFVNMVNNEVDLFHEGAPQRDDLTVLTVRRLK
ncbi:MAG: PP2C family protein-serine/threonine phosphatase, partial [Planctomycetota bacterium]